MTVYFAQERKPQRKARRKPLMRSAFPVERIDRHIIFDAYVLSGLLAAAPGERCRLSGLVNRICEDWLRRRVEGGAK
jgi:hypothetical protein